MATSVSRHRAWGDKHTLYLNNLYALYHKQVSWAQQFCDIGYQGFPDPKYETKNKEYTPDFLSVGKQGDIQHIDVKGFENIEDHFDGREDDIKDKIRNSLSDLAKYRGITDTMVSEYLLEKGVRTEPTAHEIVALLPYKIYDKYKPTVEDIIRTEDLILWVIDINGGSGLWKVIGNHNSTNLNDHLEEKIETYPAANDLIQFTRDTETAIKKYKFAEKLVKYCAREQTRTFNFDQIDAIMTEIRPPLLEHLPEQERADIWRTYTYTMLHNLEVIEHGEAENQYIWKKKRFLREPRDRNRILEAVKDELGVN
jgi:hypothetical protein